MFYILPGKSSDFPPFLHTEPSWAITPSERSKAFIGNAGRACDKLSTKKTEGHGETKRLATTSHRASLTRKALQEEQWAVTGGRARRLHSVGVGQPNTGILTKSSGMLRKESEIKRKRECGGLVADKAFCTANQQRRLNWVHFLLQIHKVSIDLSLLSISPQSAQGE